MDDERSYQPDEIITIIRAVRAAAGSFDDLLFVFEGRYIISDLPAVMSRVALPGGASSTSAPQPPPPSPDPWSEARTANSRRLAAYQNKQPA
jgi:hypothetical protein